MNADRIPADHAAEVAVLAGALTRPERLDALDLTPADFASQDNGRLYGALVAARADGIPSEIPALVKFFETRCGMDPDSTGRHLARLLDSDPATALTHYAARIREAAQARRLLHKTGELQDFLMNGRAPERIARLLAELHEMDAGAGSDRPGLETAPVGAFLSEEDAPLREHLPGYLGVGDRLVVAAPPKSGKSLTCRALALSIATGRDFAGLSVRFTPAGVLWLDLEEGRDHLRRAFRRLAAGLDLTEAELGRAPLHVASLTGFDMATRAGDLGKAIRDTGAEWVFIDTLRRAMPHAGHSEKDAEFGAAVSEAVDRIRQAAGRAVGVGVLGHTTKAREAGAELWKALRGTGDLGALSDTVWAIEGNIGDGARWRTLRRHGGHVPDRRLQLVEEGPALRLVQPEADASGETCAAALEAVLTAGKHAPQHRELLQRLGGAGLSERQARQTVAAGLDAGTVVKGRPQGERYPRYYLAGEAPEGLL